MVEQYEHTKKAVLKAVQERAQQTKPIRIKSGAKALGIYLQKCLQSRHISRVTFAQTLEMETELADAILDGVLPDSELHAELLAELAEAAGCEYGRLREILTGDIETPANGWV